MGAPLVVFPDAVAVTISAIATGFTAQSEDADVTDETPTPRPTKYVLVRRLGGPRRDLVTDEPQLEVEAYGATNTEAHDLAELARAYVLGMRGTVIDGVSVYSVNEYSGPKKLPDPTTTSPRYTFGVVAAMRGTALT